MEEDYKEEEVLDHHNCIDRLVGLYHVKKSLM